MILVRGKAGGTALTGTVFEPDETPPEFSGVPEDGSPYVWVCDEFYEVESGGTVQKIGDRKVNIAFESPMPRGFETRKGVLNAAKEHLRTQFARVGVPREEVDIEILKD